MSLESDIIRIEAALAAMDADPDTMPGQWAVCTLPLDHIDREFVDACRPDAIRRLIRIARAADCLADELDNLMNILVPAARKALAAYRAMKEQQP